MEFVKSEKNGSLPPWLLDTSTLRYVGDGKSYELVGKPVIETARNYDNRDWSIRGFYGITSDPVETSCIIGLGVIWGRD